MTLSTRDRTGLILANFVLGFLLLGFIPPLGAFLLLIGTLMTINHVLR